ncbi:TPM domain-containing protein [Flavobacterium branchiicola]|uniref:TPM domain-containing protein n=1 Tax=Flavobacterium branchiicola TaxID=1114875 RepID=A0ABV9PF37_9FLAO|nr:TPM domain-containing protein [Flavobacterium branchiicola]MBS7254731.1 TPM domain-containing protein [Flavobacterium branchiicola]
MKKILFVLTLTLFLSHSIFAQTKTEAQNIFAKSYDNVNDFEKILTPAQIKNLNDFLKANEAKTKNKILIVTTASIKPYTDLTDYAMDLDKHLLSKLKLDTTVLIVISKQLRQIQVQGTDKIRSKMTDQDMRNIVSTYVIPELKKGDYYKALQEGTLQMTKKME